MFRTLGVTRGFSIGPWFTQVISPHNPWTQFLLAVVILLGVAILVLVVTFVVSRAISGWLRGRLVAGGFHVNIAILLGRAVWISIWAVGILLILYFLGIGLAPLAAFIGVVGLAAGLSLQQVLQNLVAGVYLLAERPFRIGDVIAVVGPAGLNHVGRVEDIQMRTTHLRSLDDEVILVPNSSIFSGIITNRTVVGGSAVHLTITFPRSAHLQTSREKTLTDVQGTRGVLSQPAPEFRVTCVDKEVWTASLTFWADSLQVETGVLWGIGESFPEATVASAGGVV
ncbi:MAG: mechanosensitive ion channel family protein [Chloroflexota bacterium]|nr:mechanosensitive ion channel family protein [Chloroflexota bacterium]